MMKQAIEDLGYTPGRDVVLALDPAASELENAYRKDKEFNQPNAVGQYLFWRDKSQKLVMSRDVLLALYRRALEEDIPIVSIEDAFSERDWEGWKAFAEEFGGITETGEVDWEKARLFVIGDDLVTTNDATIEKASERHAINTVLIKANQIGTLTETTLAMLVALGKGMELVISHRSKKPNDTMEADLALASSAMGLKSGGGANTERLVVYKAVIDLMRKTSTQTGLSVTVRVLDKVYEAGRKVAAAFKQNMPIVFDTFLPKWNYRILPQSG